MNGYFGGNSLASFFRNTTANVEVTTAGRFDSAFVASAIKVLSNSPSNDYIETPAFSATGTVWMHFEAYLVGSMSGSGNAFLHILNGATNVFRLVGSSSTTLKGQYWTGGAWTDNGTTWTIPTGTLLRLDLKVTLNSDWALYSAGTSVASGSGWSGGQTTMTSVRFVDPLAGGVFFSQVLIGDFDNRDGKYEAAALNGNSASNTGGTGAYTDINETVLDDSTSEVVATSGNKMGATHAAITVPSGYLIFAMVIGARGRVSGSITDGKLGIRSGGTNYSSSGRTYNAGYEPRVFINQVDPATSTQFTQSGFNAAETYLEAV